MTLKSLLRSIALWGLAYAAPLSATSSLDYQTIDISLQDAQGFPGNWSLLPEEIYLALKYCKYQKKIKILEFGAGQSTIELAKLLTKKGIPFEYHVFENDPAYVREIPNVVYHLYDLPALSFGRCDEWKAPIAEYQLPELPIFDLVIVDGPHGVARAKWYEKFKKYTKLGTVVLIDDFHHYAEFGTALDKHFSYATIIEYNQSPSWKIINAGLESLPDHSLNKTFKIVRISLTKE